MNPEIVHDFTLEFLHSMPLAARLVSPNFTAPNSLLQTLWGLPFRHPIGLAAGLDKNAEAVDGLLTCGFSFIEVGTVTPRPQPGNPSPRLFRLVNDEALINRMGFNNRGVDQLCRNLETRQKPGIVGINIGKNKTTPNEQAMEDYLICLDEVLPHADYVVLNVSSPNTPGLRDLQSEEALFPLVKTVLSRRDSRIESTQHPIPVLVKLAPDLSEEAIEGLASGLLQLGVDGFIATNTTISREGLVSEARTQSGGLSGKPLRSKSTQVIRTLFNITRGQVPIIGSGGIMSPDDAWEKILAGANLLQLYTGFIYHGPSVIREIALDLNRRLAANGFQTLSEAVGTGQTQ